MDFTTPICKDESWMCRFNSWKAKCDTDDKVRLKCPKACGICGGEITTLAPPSPSSSAPPSPPPPASCKNKNSDARCEKIAKRGYCEQKRYWEYCKKTCGCNKF